MRALWSPIPLAGITSIFLALGWVSNLSARSAQQEQGIPPHILTFESFPPLSSQTSALTDSSGNVDDEQKADNKEIQISLLSLAADLILNCNQPTCLLRDQKTSGSMTEQKIENSRLLPFTLERWLVSPSPGCGFGYRTALWTV